MQLIEGNKDELEKGTFDFNTVKTAAFDPFFFWFNYVSNGRLSVKYCAEHLDKLHTEIANKLSIPKTERKELTNNLELLTFPLPQDDENAPLWEIECGKQGCHNKAVKAGVLARPSTVTMETIIERQLSERALNAMSSIVNEVLEHTPEKESSPAPFSNLHNKLYKKLNTYAHGNFSLIPGLNEWIQDYFSKAIRLCTYLPMVLATPDLQRKVDWGKLMQEGGE